jgi:bacteriorhodopsin
MEKSESKNNYIYIALAVIVLVAMLVWAYMSGRNDGAEHNADRANQNVNQTK